MTDNQQVNPLPLERLACVREMRVSDRLGRELFEIPVDHTFLSHVLGGDENLPGLCSIQNRTCAVTLAGNILKSPCGHDR